MMRENDGLQNKMNLLFHSECTNQPLSVEPATEEVFHVELKDRKDKPLKLNRNKKQTVNHPPTPLSLQVFYSAAAGKVFFSKKGHSSRPGVPSACRLDKPSNCLGWRCSSRFPAAWTIQLEDERNPVAKTPGNHEFGTSSSRRKIAWIDDVSGQLLFKVPS